MQTRSVYVIEILRIILYAHRTLVHKPAHVSLLLTHRLFGLLLYMNKPLTPNTEQTNSVFTS
ncbi:MAG: hypothetical protein ABS880_10275, partial [Psychrobacter alimentarius]